MRQTKDCRLVFELNNKLPANSFVLAPNDSEGFRLVIDLGDSVGLFEVQDPPTVMAENAKELKEVKEFKETNKPKRALKPGTRPFIIAIDPGHGGPDPGAVGKTYKTQEKEVVLAVAKRLRDIINQENHMKAFLTRDGDYFITLRRRINMAREMGADIFVSLHADSQPNGQNAKGASVYVLSDKGASSEAARWLADRENKADWIGGAKLESKNPTLASVLLDLSQTISQQSSEELGDSVLTSLGRFASLHKKNIERAAFVVLKSPDIPSILVELEFLSNQDGEDRLRQPVYQQKLAEGVFSGLREYFSKRSLPPAHPHMQDMHNGLDVASVN
jgi:N-acetylmuramoyl-L-alanine amidase